LYTETLFQTEAGTLVGCWKWQYVSSELLTFETYLWISFDVRLAT